MKNIFLKLLMIGAAAFPLLSCENTDGTLPALSVDSPAAVSFNAAGGEKIITVATNQESWDVAMTPADGNGWLTLDKYANAFSLKAVANTETVSPASVSIVVTAGSAQAVIMTITQKPFEPSVSTYSIGDYYPNGTSPVGIVVWIDPAGGGTSGKAVSLDEPADTKAWGDMSDLGASSLDDGQSNTAAIGSASELATWCRAKGDGWYLPAKNEYKMIYAASCGLTYDPGLWAGDYSSMTDYQNETYAAAREAFKQKIEDAGGTAFGFGDYWTSSENATNPSMEAWYLSLAWGGSSSTGYKNGKYTARAMLAF